MAALAEDEQGEHVAIEEEGSGRKACRERKGG